MTSRGDGKDDQLLLDNNGAEVKMFHILQFPWKVHRLLEESERNGDDDIISWLTDSKAFKVHNREEFSRRIMPDYFNSSKYKTFQRSLHLWGFESEFKGSDKGAYFHKCFIRGQPDLCENMHRVKIKGRQTPPAAKALSNITTASTAQRPRVEMSTLSEYILRRTHSFDNEAPIGELLVNSRMANLNSELLLNLLKAAYERDEQREALLRAMSPLNLRSLSMLSSAQHAVATTLFWNEHTSA